MATDTNKARSIQEFVETRIEEIVSNYESTPALILFMGMTAPLARTALSSRHALPGTSDAFDSSGHLDFEKLSSQDMKNQITMGLMSLDGPRILLYEQALPVQQILDNLFSGTIVIVKNNLFAQTNPIPCAAAEEELEDLFNAIEAGASEPTGAIGSFYAEVTPAEQGWLVKPVLLDLPNSNVDDSSQSLFPADSAAPVNGTPSNQPVYVSENALASYAKRLLLGEKPQPVSFIWEDAEAGNRSLLNQQGAIASVLEFLGITSESLKSEILQEASNPERLLPYLKKYWGPDAEFRTLRIYENPDRDNKMAEISQGDVADLAVVQAECALNGQGGYRDIFVTAPTGAGKSLLFQLPAIYLAEHYSAVTIVIEPLKALMRDQVSSLRHRGVRNVVAINSDQSYDERLEAYEKIKAGEVSIVYLSPELLLGSSILEIVSSRKLGLVVIDEVHTVTSWGKDFRPDYWYLGSYLAKCRKREMDFPVFCMTATAVYGGRDDAVMQTVRDLELISPHIMLGNPRRNDISFDIRRVPKSQYAGRIDEVKTSLAVAAAQRFVGNDSHAIIYCPYRSHVNAVTEAAVGNFDGSSKVLGFHGGMDNDYKKHVEASFKDRTCLVLVSTKAFGMGVDVDDITDVYHYAPTGNLSDYVQEIGRGARKKNLTATASIDFFQSDSSYARQLYQLSRFYDWQLRDIMEKLYELYTSRPTGKRSQNLLVSPDSFSYLFPDETDDTKRVNKTKSALMMVSKDLEERFGFPVVIVRPKPSFTKCFICIDSSISRQFAASYGTYIKLVHSQTQRTEHHAGQHDVHITDAGDIYELNAASMWEEQFPSYTFADFKRRLFTGELLPFDTDGLVSSRVKLQIKFKTNADTVRGLFSAYAQALEGVFTQLARGGEFSDTDFKQVFAEHLGASAPALENPKLLLKSFINPIDSSNYGKKSQRFKFIIRRTSGKQTGKSMSATYKVKYADVMSLADTLVQKLEVVIPSRGDTYVRYLKNIGAGSISTIAELLEVLGLASYEARGGEEPEIFVRLNDPGKLHQLAQNDKFRNRVLRDMNSRHQYASEVITRFFNSDMNDAERWDLIEEYFLGNDNRVAQILGMDCDSDDPIVSKIRYRGKQELFLGPTLSIASEGNRFEGPLFRLWNELTQSCSNAQELADLQVLKSNMRGNAYERPYQHAVLELQDDPAPIQPLLIWKGSRVILFGLSQKHDFERASSSDWTCYLLGESNVDDLAANTHTPIEIG